MRGKLYKESLCVKPIFHCAAKPFTFRFASPNAKDTNISFVLGDAKKHLRHLTQNPNVRSVEYRLRWVPNVKVLALGMYISYCLCQFDLH